MPDRKLDEFAGNLDDLSTEVDELKEENEGLDRARLDRIAAALEEARDVVDDIVDDDGESNRT